MWDLIVSVPDHCISFCLKKFPYRVMLILSLFSLPFYIVLLKFC